MRIKETLVGVVVAAAGGATALFGASTTIGTVVTTVGAVLIVWYGLSEEPSK